MNLAAMVVNGVLACASIMGFASVELATCGIVATVALRDLVFERFMARKFGNRFVGFCVAEALLTIGFMAASWFMGVWSWPLVAAMLGVYLWVDRDGMRLIATEAERKLGCL